MYLSSYNAVQEFAKQLERNIGGVNFHTKVVVTPSSINEAGVVIKVSLLKTFIPNEPPAAKSSRSVRIRVTVAGRIESMTGLKQATEAIEALDRYLMSPDLRLEVMNGSQIPVGISNSRITQQIREEDSFLDSPDSIKVQDVQDDRIVIITFPQGGN